MYRCPNPIQVVSGFLWNRWIAGLVVSLTLFFFSSSLALAGSCSSAATGNWIATSTWTVGCGGGGTAQVPTLADDVTILNTHNVTVASGVNASSTAVTVDSGGTLTLTSTGGLTASGNFLNNGTVTGTGALNLTGSGTTMDGTGLFTGLTGTTTITNDKTISSTATLSFGGAMAVSTGTTTNNGTTTVTGNISGGGAWTQGSGSTLTFGGAVLSVATSSFITASNTVNYNRAGTQTCKVTQYYNLTMSGTSAKTCVLTATSNVLGDVRMAGTATWTLTATTSFAGQLFIQGGTITTGGVGLDVTGTTTISSGTFSFTNNTSIKKLIGPVILTGGTMSGASTNIRFGSGITNNGGTVSITGTVTILDAGVIFGGSSLIAIANLTATSSGTVTSNGSFAASGAVTITSPATFTNNGSTTVVGNLAGTGSWTQGTDSTLNAGGNTTSALGITTTNLTASGNTVNYNRAGTQTCKVTQYYNLTFGGTSAKTCALTSNVLGDVRMQGTTAQWTLTTAFDIAGQLFIQGGTITTGAVAFNVTGTTTVSSGTLTFTNNTAIKKLIGPVVQTGGTINGASTNIRFGSSVTSSGGSFAVTGTVTIVDAGVSFNGTNTLSIAAITVTSPGTVTNNATTTVSGTITGTGGWTQGASSTLNASGGTTNAMGVTTTSFTASGNTVNYALAGAQTCKVTQYYNLTLSGSGAKTCALTSNVLGDVRVQGTATWTMTTAFDIVGQLFVSGGTLTTGAVAFDVTATTTITSGTTTITSNTGIKRFIGPVIISGGVLNGASNNLQFENGLAQSSTGLVTLTGTSTFQTTATQSISGTLGFGDVVVGSGVTLSNSGTTTLAGSLTLTGNLTNVGSAPLTIGRNFANSGTFTAGTATTTFSGTVAQALSGTLTGASALGKVAFSGAGTKTFSNNASTTNFLINSGSGDVVAPASLSISGDYSNGGTFTAGTGTTTLSGTTAQTIAGTMTGTSAFNNLVVANNTATTTFTSDLTVGDTFTATTPGTKLAFAEDATTTIDTAIISGSAVSTTTIRSTTAGVQSNLAVTGTYNFSYLDVADSNACGSVGGEIDIINSNSTDSGNNTCWTFVVNPGNLLTVSGILFEADRLTPQATSKSVTLALVATTTIATFSTTTEATTGTFTFDINVGALVATGTPVTLFVDNDATIKAVTVTKTNGSTTIADLDLYQDHVVLKNEGGTGTTTKLTDLFTYDSADDADVLFTASSTIGRLTITPGQTLYVASGTTAHLDLPIEGHHFTLATSGTALASSTMELTGNYLNSGSFLSAATSTWTATSALGDDDSWSSVAYGNGLFVAVGFCDGVTYECIMSSSDGINWTAYDTSGEQSWKSVIYGDGLFVAVGTNIVGTSTNGITWGTSTSLSGDDRWTSVTYGEGLFVAVANSYGGNVVMISPDGTNWSTSSAADNEWNSVTYGNGMFVAVGNPYTSDVVMTSPDGVAWTTHSVMGNNDYWQSVTYGNGLFVAVGNGPDKLMASLDGVTWATSSGVDNNWASVTYGNGLFVAVAPSGTNHAITSPDGFTWTAHPATTAYGWYSVTYGNGLFVAVAQNSINPVMSSPESFPITLSGTTTQTLTGNLTSSNALPSILAKEAGAKTFNNNASTTDLIIATSSGNVTAPTALSISASLDNGSTFIGDEVVYVDSNLTNSGTLTTPADLYVVGSLTNTNTLTASANIYLGGDLTNSGTFTAPVNFYLNGNNQTASGTMTGTSALNNITLSSISTSTKTFSTNASTSNLTIETDTTFTAPAEISIAGGYTNNGTSSYVGTTWTGRSGAGSNDTWRSVTYGNGLFVAVAADGTNQVMTSPDGITWTGRTTGASNVWGSVTYGNGLFVAVPYSELSNIPTTTLMTSPDGITWTQGTVAEAAYWNSVIYAEGLFVAVGNSGGNDVMTSLDGINWTSRSAAGDDDNWNSVTYGNGLFVAVGETNGVYDAVMTSSDGITWATTSAVGDNDSWQEVAYGNGLFVAVGSVGGGDDVIMTSPDGVTWTSRSDASNSGYWNSVTYGNGLFVATNCNDCGGSYAYMTSLDGITWNARSIPGMFNSWTSVTYGNGLFVAVASTFGGGYSPVMTSPVWSTTTFSGTTSQSISGNLNGASAFGNVVFSDVGTKTFSDNASTSNFTIQAGSGTTTAPASLSIRGSYTNNSVFDAGSGVVALDGYISQTATGTMTGTSAFNNLVVSNNSATTTFGTALTVDDTFTATAVGTKLAFASGATTTIANATITGSSSAKTILRSTTDGVQSNLAITTSYDLSYIDVADSNACGSVGGGIELLSGNDTNSGNNTCWTFPINPGETLTVSGILFEADRTTPQATSKNVTLALVATTTIATFSTTTEATTGTFTFDINVGALVATGTPVTLFVDNDATIKAVTVTKTNGTSTITDLDLYQDHVVLKNEGGTATTTKATDLFTFDSADDADVLFTASSTLGRLTITPGQTLYVASGTTAHLDLPIEGHHFTVATSGTALSSSTLELTGNYLNSGSLVTADPAWATTSAAGDDDGWSSVAYGNGLFVAVGYSGDRVMTSIDGINWATTSAAGDDDSWLSVTYGEGLFVAVGGFGNNDVVMTSSNGISWTTTNAAGDDDTWSSVTYGNGLFVAVGFGAGDRVMTSPDGISWSTTSAAGDDDSWASVTYGEGLFVAVSYAGTDRVMTSPDGITWTARSATDNDDEWYSITYGNGLFVVVGGTGDHVMTSTNGIDWTARTAVGNNDLWSSINYGSGLFVAVGYSGDHVMTSPNGIDWTARTPAGNNDNWTSVTYGNGFFVAVGYSGDRVMISSESFPVTLSGTTTQTLSGNLSGTNTLPSLLMKEAGTKTFSNNASTTDIIIATSSGDVTAPTALSVTASLTNGSTFIGDEVVYVGDYLTNTGTLTAPTDIYITGNLINSDTFISSANVYLRGNLTNSGTLTAPANLYFNGNDQIASGTMTGTSALNNVTLSSVSSSTKTFSTNASTSNITIEAGTTFTAPAEFSVSGNYTNNGTSTNQAGVWTSRSAAGNDDVWESISYNNGLFVAVGYDGDNRVMTSPDGINWTAQSAAGNDDFWTGVTYGNGLFVAVGCGPCTGGSVMTSPDGENWTTRSAVGNDDYWQDITYGNGLFVAVGNGPDNVMASPDGINWTAQSAVTGSWYGITYGNGLYVAVGGVCDGITNTECIMTSPDGIDWTARSAAGNDDGWASVTYGEGLFVAVSYAGTDRVMTSPDGITWTARSAVGSDDSWSSVTYGNGLFVAVGGGTDYVMTSVDGITWSSYSAVVGSWHGITYSNGLFVAVGGGNDVVMTSPIWSTTTFSGTTSQSISGNLNGASAFGNVVFSDVGTKTFSDNASTSNFTIQAGSGTTTAPASLSIRGSYTNNSVFDAGSGVVALDGYIAQTATGTMTGTSAFNNLVVSNNSATTTFGTALTVDDTFTATAVGTKLAFAANATATIASTTITGSSANKIILRSTSLGTRFGFVVTGAYDISYINVKDSSGESTLTGDIIATSSIDAGNNVGWSFTIDPGDYLNISGVLYEEDRVTPKSNVATATIALMVDSVITTFSTSTLASTGEFTFSVLVGAIATATPVTLFVDNDAVIKAVTVTKTNGSSTIADLDLYQNHVTLKNEGGSDVTTETSDLSAYDSTNDADIQFTASSTLGRFTVAPGQTLYVASGTTASLDLPIVGHHFTIATSATALASSTISLTGNYHNSGSLVTSDPTWTALSAVGDDDFWTAVTYGNGMFVAVSSGGSDRIMSSPDGVTWTARTNPQANSWSSITYGNGLFVAVSTFAVDANRIMTSPDGITWTIRTAPSSSIWKSVTYGNGLFVAVSCGEGFSCGSEYDRVITSPDGITWTARSAVGNYDDWTSVTYGSGRFVAVSSGSNNPIMTSTDGITWATTSAPGQNNYWQSITYGNGLFVAVGLCTPEGYCVMTSPDGVVWTGRSAVGNNDYWRSVTYGNGLFVAVGDVGAGVMTSSDGINWTARSAADNNDYWLGVTYGSGRFVAVGGGTDRVITSSESYPLTLSGTTSQALSGNLTEGNIIPSLLFKEAGTKTFLNNASTTDIIIASSSGTVTATGTLSLARDYHNSGLFTVPTNLYLSGDKQVASGTWSGTPNLFISGSGAKTLYSDVEVNDLSVVTGATLNASPVLTIDGDISVSGSTTNRLGSFYKYRAPDYIQEIAYGNGLYVAVGNSSQRVMTSVDGVTWATTSAAGNDDNWSSVTYGNGLFVAVGQSGDRVMTSVDGVTWTARSTAGNDYAWQSVTYGNGLFVAVADSGSNQVMTSPDGINWTGRTAAANIIWQDVAYGNGTFVAVSCGFAYSYCDTDVGTRVMYSTDGVTWDAADAVGNNDTWNSVAFGNGLFVAVSNTGTNRVMTSPDGITWTAQTVLGNNDEWQSVAFGGGVFVAVGSGFSIPATDFAMMSEDGVNWSRLNINNDTEYDFVTFGGGRFVFRKNYETNIGLSVFSTWQLGGSSMKNISGQLIGPDSLGSVEVTNTTGVEFSNSINVANNFVATTSGVEIRFAAGATSTLANVSVLGEEIDPVLLRSTTNGVKFGLVVTGDYLFNNVDVKDSNGSTSAGDIEAIGTSTGNVTGWNFYVFGITLADGSALPNTVAYPSGDATTTKVFTLVTDNATTTIVTSLSIALQGAYATTGIARIEITSADGSTVYGSTTNPVASPVTITLDQNVLTASTTPVEYLVRVVPKTHADMPPAPGAEYTVSTKVDTWVSGGLPLNNGTFGRTVTIDNLSTDVSGTSTVTYFSENFETGNLNGTTTGDAVWDVDTSSVGGGVYSAVSGTIADGQISSLEFVVDVTEEGSKLYFDLRTSTQIYQDYLNLYLNDVSVTGWSGDTAWSAAGPYELATGTQTIRFSYEKYGSIPDGEDAVWVDNITIVYDAPVEPSAYSTTNTNAVISHLPPPDTDYTSTVVLVSTSTITEVPAEGETYTAGTVIGSSSVACVDTVGTNASISSCTASGLIEGETYNFKVFARDRAGNYSVGTDLIGYVLNLVPGDFLNVSGILYEDDHVTPQSATTTVTVALVATTTLATYSTTTEASTGAFDFNIYIGSLVATSTPVTLFVDNDATIKAVTVTKTNGTSTIEDLDLYQDHVVLKNEGGTGTTTKLTDLYTYDSADDADVLFAASSTLGRLTITPGQTLYVASGTTAHLDLPIEGHDFTVATSGVALASSTIELTGNFIQNGAFRINSASSSVWTERDVTSAKDWVSITYGNGLFVAVNDNNSATAAVMTSPDGITWTDRNVTSAKAWQSVTYGNGLFVAVNDNNSATAAVMTSPDGINWTNRNVPDAKYWTSVTYGNGLFVAVNGSLGLGTSATGAVMTSPDGITWTSRNVPDTKHWQSVTYGNGLFVAVSADSDATGAVMTSPDGITWTSRNVPDAKNWKSVTYGNGLFVAVNFDNDATGAVMTSPDGITWTSRNVPDAKGWFGVTYGNGLFVAVSGGFPSATTTVMTSTDGIVWISNDVSLVKDWRSITYGNGLFVAANTDRVATAAVMTSIGWENIVFAGTSSQSISGSLTGANAFGNLLLSGAGTKTFADSASTTSLIVDTIATTTFNGALEVSDTLTANAGAKVVIASGATTTVGTLVLNGSAIAPVSLTATTPDTQANFVLSGSSTVTYTTIRDNNACGSTGGVIDVSGANNTDGGNTDCWTFVSDAPVLSIGSNQEFYSGEATTTLATITLTDIETPTITTTGDIRLTIATTTTNFRFNTSVTTPTFGGNASGKVDSTVSYEDDGATLLITVTENFTATNTLTIAGLEVGSFGSVSTTTSRLALHTDGDSAGTPATLSSETFRITGLLTLSDHDADQVENQFSFMNRTEATFFAFKLSPVGENATITDSVITLSGIQGITAEKLHTFKLYQDNNADLALDGGDTLIDSNGIMTINGQHGAITFSTDFLSTTTRNYILIADTTDTERGDAVVFSIQANGLTAVGQDSLYQPQISGTISAVQHERYGAGAGGGSGRVGGEAPAGDGDVGGGEEGGGGGVGQEEDGENIAPDPDYSRPASTGSGDNEWTNPTNAYNSDGTYATAASTHRQSYTNFNFNIPLTNTIQGISVKLDASGSTAEGTIDVALSWDGGNSYTTGKATPTLVGSDIVYIVGGATDTWGRAWTASEFSTENFLLKVTAAPSSNTIRLDALEIRVHHQAGGGGGGGGGRI